MMPSETTHRSVAANSIQKRRLGLIIILAITAGTGLVWILERNGSRSFPGVLQAKITVVAASRPARVQLISVKTGQSVIPGDALVQLTDPQLEERMISKRREIAGLEAEVARSKATAEIELSWRRRDLQTEIFETQLKMASLSQEKLNKQVEEIAWKDQLSNGDLNVGSIARESDLPFRPISMEVHLPDDRKMQAMLREDAAAAAAETLAFQIALCEKRLKYLQSLDQELELKIRASSGIDVADTRLKMAHQELEAIESQSQELMIASPTYGTLGEVKLQSGELIAQGATLAEILDGSQPHIVAQIPAGVASKLMPGSKVSIVFPMNQLRTGTIKLIPPRTISNADGTGSFVAVKIEPSGKLWPTLAFGSSVNVQLQ